MTDIKKIAGVVWYRSEDYEAIRKIMADGRDLPGDYPIWRMKAEHSEKVAHRAGFSTVRAYIDPLTFPDWCIAHGMEINSAARNQFANEVAFKTAQNTD